MSWDQLKTILDEARQTSKEEQMKPPTACPIDSEPLTTDARGQLRCRFCGNAYGGGPRS